MDVSKPAVTSYNVESDPKLISLGDSEILLQSPFIREEVMALKATVPDARWDRISGMWRIPVMSREAAVDFAEVWGYTVTDELLRMDLPTNPLPPSNIEITGKHVAIKFPYDQLKVTEVKKIPQIRWHANTKSWRAPLSSLVDVVDFAKEHRLQVSDAAVEEAERLQEARESSVAASHAKDAVIKVEGLAADPYPFQRAGIAYATSKRRTFIADEMGLGKTLQSLASVERVGEYPCVVVAPPSLLLNWQYEINKLLPHRTVTIIRGRGDFPEHETDFTIIGYSNISHHVTAIENKGYQSAIFDESQAYKNYKAQRTIAAIKIGHAIPKDGMVLLLTGTPITGRPTEFEPQLDIMGRISEFGGRWAFFMRFCGAWKGEDNRYHMDGTIPKGRLKELNTKLRQICYVRRLKKDVLEDLPEMMENIVYVELSDKWKAEYAKAESGIVEYFSNLKAQIAEELGEDATEARIRAKIAARSAEHLIKLSVLKKIAAYGKLDAAQEWIDARKEEGNKTIIGAHHREITESLAAANGGLKILGGQPTESIEADKKAFQELSCEEAPVIVLSIQAAKTGHTLHASSHVLELELPWVPTDEDQLFGRAHRIGQAKDVQATRMLAVDTIDIDTYNLLNKKRKIVNESVDGVAPEETTKHLNMMVIERYLK